MSRYREQLAAAIGAVEIRGSTRYAWLGRASRRLAPAVDAALDDRGRRTYLVACLREELYSSFYCHGRPVPARWGEPDPGFPDPQLTAALSRANTGGGSWDARWTVTRRDKTAATVATSRLRARVSAGDCRSDVAAIEPGTPVRLRVPKELLAWSPGFYTAVGDAIQEDFTSPATVRVYWNVTCSGAPALVRAITSVLNRAGVPFRCKVADHPYRFARCDAAVLYLGAASFLSTRAALRDVARGLGGHLRPEIPAFTLAFAPGVGLAEDDGSGGESFGTRRCDLLADAIVRAHEQGRTAAAARLDAAVDRFARDGVQIDAPYLEPSLAGRHVL